MKSQQNQQHRWEKSSNFSFRVNTRNRFSVVCFCDEYNRAVNGQDKKLTLLESGETEKIVIVKGLQREKNEKEKCTNFSSNNHFISFHPSLFEYFYYATLFASPSQSYAYCIKLSSSQKAKLTFWIDSIAICKGTLEFVLILHFVSVTVQNVVFLAFSSMKKGLLSPNFLLIVQ